ncbi:STAS domain-containing protein [Nocardia grenadensis]
MNRPSARRPPPSASAPRRSPCDQLSFRVHRRGDIVILAVRGQADAFTLPLWRQQVRVAAETVNGPRGALIVDTTRLDFLSVRSLAALSDEAQEFRRKGIEILLVTAVPALARIARADTRTALLPVCSTVVSALTAVHLPRRTPQVVSGQSGKERMRAPAGPGVTDRSKLPDAVTAVPAPLAP